MHNILVKLKSFGHIGCTISKQEIKIQKNNNIKYTSIGQN